MFISPTDFITLINPTFLKEITAGDYTILYNVSEIAYAEVVSYIPKDYYNTDVNVPYFQPFDKTKTYYSPDINTPSFVYFTDNSSSGTYPAPFCYNTTYYESSSTSGYHSTAFIASDWTTITRHPQLVQLCADIAIYHLYSRVSQRDTPQKITDRYHQATEYLHKIQKGQVTPPWLQLATQPTHDWNSTYRRWGSDGIEYAPDPQTGKVYKKNRNFF